MNNTTDEHFIRSPSTSTEEDNDDAASPPTIPHTNMKRHRQSPTTDDDNMSPASSQPIPKHPNTGQQHRGSILTPQQLNKSGHSITRV